FCSSTRRAQRATPFPYTTLFRSLNFVNAAGELIDRVNYSLSWYNNAGKTDGGWSLERINPEEPCRAGDNWRASVAQAGGTPGTRSEEHTSELQSRENLVCRLLLE